MRRFFKKIHLWISIPLGILFSVICFTGASLVFEQEITRALNPHLYRVEAPDGAEPLRPSQLVERLRRQLPDTLQLASLQLAGDPHSVCLASFSNAGRQTMSINPMTGESLGWTHTPAFFSTVRQLHRWLMDAPASRGEQSFGKVVVGITTLAMVFVLISGLVIWIPRKRGSLKNRLKVSCSGGWRRFWHDTHVALGFYATFFLLLMALTGLTWSFGWYRTAVYSLFGGGEQRTEQRAEASRVRGSSQSAGHHSMEHAAGSSHAGGAPRSGSGRSDSTQPFDYALWDGVLEQLQSVYPVYRTITLGMGTVQIAPDPTTSMRRTDTASFDLRDGSLGPIARYADTSRSQKLRGWFYAFHTGSWGGIWTKILYFLAALIGGSLPWTGYYLWLKRLTSGPKHP